MHSAACSRHRGVGADQLVLIEASNSPDCAARVRFFNVDGREVGACGNATRCVARLLFDERPGLTSLTLATDGGLVSAVLGVGGARITIRLPPPRFEWSDVPLAAERETASVAELSPAPGWPPALCLSVGNPQCVCFAPAGIGELQELDLAALAAPIERHALFPEGANVMLVAVETTAAGGGKLLRVRPWERSVGATQACTTGACAALVAAALRGLLPPLPQAGGGLRWAAEVQFATAAGGRLGVAWREDGIIEASGGTAISFYGQLPSANLVG